MEAKVFQIDSKKLSSRGEEIYERIRERLELEHKGEIVAIEVDSGDYFLGKTVVEAGMKAREKHPDKVFYFIRIGFPAVHTFR
ncbi:MAG: hypothetical protein ACUVV0_15205 [Anaerolineae bacterium]